jgi:plastocyanin
MRSPPRIPRPLAIVLTAMSFLLLVTACGSAGPGGSAAEGSAPADTIVIKGFGYAVPASVRPGAELTIRNEDKVAHTVTAKPGHAFDVAVDASATTTMTAPSRPGRYAFICTYHPYMHATLVVKR